MSQTKNLNGMYCMEIPTNRLVWKSINLCEGRYNFLSHAHIFKIHHYKVHKTTAVAAAVTFANIKKFGRHLENIGKEGFKS